MKVYCKDLKDLPERIASSIITKTREDEFFAAIKTDVRPNSTIPFLWLVCTAHHLLACSTHRTRGIFKAIPWEDINELRGLGSGRAQIIEIIFHDLEVANEIYPLASGVDKKETEEFVALCKSKRKYKTP